MFEYWRFDPAGDGASLLVGASGWGMGQQPADAGEVGFISPVGIGRS